MSHSLAFSNSMTDTSTASNNLVSEVIEWQQTPRTTGKPEHHPRTRTTENGSCPSRLGYGSRTAAQVEREAHNDASIRDMKARISLAKLFISTLEQAAEQGESVPYVPVWDLIGLDDTVLFQQQGNPEDPIASGRAKTLLSQYISLKQKQIVKAQSNFFLSHHYQNQAIA
ncbi:hypothetical protein SCOR_23185 [Sulfidibacter corallicola]|uniref:Uncharacterized protein n=1 Tax=Sulfidibacter corallicola TaxID=2818388 RepID=A0A8A4U1S8_SULCO|nr:hypothetical protein [Sulfidibacter corallicola]QTD52685.1 hypothetical protein J3U87_09435 [Sulfidibacter corallicola]